MKIPAIRAKMGTWDYYVTTLTFSQVSEHVSKIDDQLHKSEFLRDQIQRSLTDNYLSIRDYIVNQPQFFFNALVLAVYDDYPNWIEIDFEYQNKETFVMGLLDFPGKFKIFPVDGQHRVEGIKEVLKTNPALGSQQITAVFIGHKNTDEGMKTTRRLFTTLNRYAKVVTKDDIIALDEDDIAAIVTRDLLEEFDLFVGKRVVRAKQKAMPSNNRSAITSIITLYQANIELLKYHLGDNGKNKITKKELEEFMKFRPPAAVFNQFKQAALEFWNAFLLLPDVKAFSKIEAEGAAAYRNENGGSIIFRPVGFLPVVKVALRINIRTGTKFTTIFRKIGKLNLDLNNVPWLQVLWNPIKKTMIMTTTPLAELLLLYLYDKALLTDAELKRLKEGYASQLGISESRDIETVLNRIQ